MPISPFYKPIRLVNDDLAAQNMPAPQPQFGLDVNPQLQGGGGSALTGDTGEIPGSSVPDAQPTPEPQKPLDDNQIFQNYMRQKYPEEFERGQKQANENRVSQADLSRLSDTRDLDAITGAFSRAASAAGSVNGVAAKSNYDTIAKAQNDAEQDALGNRMKLAQQGEDMQSNALKGLQNLDQQGYQASLRPLEQQAKQQQLEQGAANLEKTQMGLQQAQMDFRNQQQLQDPNSPESQTLRKLATKFGVTVDDNMAGDRLKDLIPIAEKAYNADENRKARLDLAKNRAEQTSMMRADKEGQRATAAAAKTDEKLNKRFTEAYKEIDGMKGRTGPLGKAVERVMNANAVDTMIRDNNGVLQNLTQTQLQELAIGINKMLGGSEAHGAIESLVPKNINMNATAIKDWLTSEPNGTNQQKFVELMAHTLDRERDLAQATIKSAQIKKLHGYRDLTKTDPDRFQQLLNDAQITPEEFEKGIDPVIEARRVSNEKMQKTGGSTSKGRTLYVPGRAAGGH